MSSDSPVSLYDLLPAIYRQLDSENGYVLKALTGILDKQLTELEENVSQLYRDWFIETCSEWAANYIGDLVKAPTIAVGGGSNTKQKAVVANTIAYRRRRGTLSVIEQLTSDMLGLTAAVIEYFQHVVVSTNINHLRDLRPGSLDVRKAWTHTGITPPFDSPMFTADIQPPGQNGSGFNLMNVGAVAYRSRAFTVAYRRARELTLSSGPSDGARTFVLHPSGLDCPMFNPPTPENQITSKATRRNVSSPLNPYLLYKELQQLRVGSSSQLTWFNEQAPVFRIFFTMIEDGSGPAYPRRLSRTEISPQNIAVCSLAQWKSSSWTLDSVQIDVAIDVTSGRLLVNPNLSQQPDAVDVTYAYGFPGDVGGGPYERNDSVGKLLQRPLDQVIVVTEDPDYTLPLIHPQGSVVVGSLVKAHEAWAGGGSESQFGAIILRESRDFSTLNDGSPVDFTINRGSTLLLCSGDYGVDVGDGYQGLTFSGVNASISGSLIIANTLEDSEFALNGVTILPEHSGETLSSPPLHIVSAVNDDLRQLTVSDSTLPPQFKTDQGSVIDVPNAIEVGHEGNITSELRLERCILSSVELTNGSNVSRVNLEIVSCGLLLAEGGSASVSAPDSAVSVSGSTVLGTVSARELRITDSLLLRQTTASNAQAGCVRYSFVPLAYNGNLSRTPRRFRAQPDTALAEAGITNWVDNAEATSLRNRLYPVFQSSIYPSPSLLLLSQNANQGLTGGSENGNEMGLWGFMLYSQLESSLHELTQDFLKFGMTATLETR